jgi:hypothetical protein
MRRLSAHCFHLISSYVYLSYFVGVDVEDIDNPHGGGGHSHGGGGMHGGIDPNILFQMFMQQQMRGGRGPSF